MEKPKRKVKKFLLSLVECRTQQTPMNVRAAEIYTGKPFIISPLQRTIKKTNISIMEVILTECQ